jgi:hypothetical protein
MRLSGFLPVVGRRVVVALGVAVMMMVAASAQAQTPPTTPAQPAAAQPEPPDPLKFDGSKPVMMLFSVKAPSEAAFEEAFGKLKAALAASTNAQSQAVAKSLNLLKVDAPATEQQAGAGPMLIYIVHLDPPVAGVSYQIIKLSYYSGFILPLTDKGEPGGTPEERKKIDDIYNPLVAAVANVNLWQLIKK